MDRDHLTDRDPWIVILGLDMKNFLGCPEQFAAKLAKQLDMLNLWAKIDTEAHCKAQKEVALQFTVDELMVQAVLMYNIMFRMAKCEEVTHRQEKITKAYADMCRYNQLMLDHIKGSKLYRILDHVEQ